MRESSILLFSAVLPVSSSVFGRWYWTKAFFLHVGVTLYETFVSFVLVILFSILAAVLLWMCGSLSEILDPYLVVLNSLPKSALAPTTHRMVRRHKNPRSLLQECPLQYLEVSSLYILVLKM